MKILLHTLSDKYLPHIKIRFYTIDFYYRFPFKAFFSAKSTTKLLKDRFLNKCFLKKHTPIALLFTKLQAQIIPL